jgi:hypothetical protein
MSYIFTHIEEKVPTSSLTIGRPGWLSVRHRHPGSSLVKVQTRFLDEYTKRPHVESVFFGSNVSFCEAQTQPGFGPEMHSLNMFVRCCSTHEVFRSSI